MQAVMGKQGIYFAWPYWPSKSTPRSKLSNECLIRVFGTLDFTCELHIPLRCNQPLN